MAENYGDSYTMSSFYNRIRTSSQYISPETQIRRTVVTNDNMTDLINNLDKFRDKIKRLDNYKRSTHQDAKLIRNITSFVKEYNSFKKKADASKNPQISKEMEKLEKLISENKKELKKIGVTLDKKNQLKFENYDFGTINKKVFEGLFSGKNSFIRKANKIIKGVNNYSKGNEISEEYVKYHPTTNYSQTDMAVAAACNVMDRVVTEVFNKEEFRFDGMSVMDYADVYNRILSKTPSNSEGVSNLKRISSVKQEDLSKIGITIDDSGRYNYDYVEDIEVADIAFASLFHDSAEGEPTEYVAAIKQSIYDIFCQSLRTEKIGVTIDQRA